MANGVPLVRLGVDPWHVHVWCLHVSFDDMPPAVGYIFPLVMHRSLNPSLPQVLGVRFDQETSLMANHHPMLEKP